jgi:hypothetical protein
MVAKGRVQLLSHKGAAGFTNIPRAFRNELDTCTVSKVASDGALKEGFRAIAIRMLDKIINVEVTMECMQR